MSNSRINDFRKRLCNINSPKLKYLKESDNYSEALKLIDNIKKDLNKALDLLDGDEKHLKKWESVYYALQALEIG